MYLHNSRQDSSTVSYLYKFGAAVFDEASMELTLHGQIINIEQRPKALLSVLLANVDEVMSKDELLELVWLNKPTVENVLANAVAKLRKALGDEIASRVVTHPRIGYRFTGPVERIASGRKLASQLSLSVGDPIAGRHNIRLERQLAAGDGREVWLARHQKTGEAHVFKFACDGASLKSLKREVTLYRVVSSSSAAQRAVAKIHDWNFSEPPFFVESEYAGCNLISYFADNGQGCNLSLDERIALVAGIAATVATIHESGVLHKDLKPSNILIQSDIGDEDTGVRLVDFGSGGLDFDHRLEQLGVTPLGLTEEPGTYLRSSRMYLAPELLNGQTPSIRSDVYALGIMLFQIVRNELQVTPQTNWASQIDDPILRSDIAAATHPNPDKRLASAAELADRLRQIGARREEQSLELAAAQNQRALEKSLQRTRARRPWLVAASVFFIAGLSASVWFGLEAKNAQNEALERASQAKLALDFITEILYSADPRAENGESDATVLGALNRAEIEMQTRFENDPESLATMSLATGRVYTGLQKLPEATVALQRAVQNFSELDGHSSIRTIDASYQLAYAYMTSGQLSEAQSLLDATDKASVSASELPAYMRFQAIDLRGRLLLSKNDSAAATYFERALELHAASIEDEPTYLESDLLDVVTINLAQAYSLGGQYENAIATLKSVETRLDRHAATTPDWQVGRLHMIFGYVYLSAEDYRKAEEHLEIARNISAPIFGDDSGYVAQVDEMLGMAALNSGNFSVARGALRSASLNLCALGGESSLHCLSSRSSLAETNIVSGEDELALEEFQRLVNIQRTVFGESSAERMRSTYYLALLYLRRGQNESASALIETLDRNTLVESDRTTEWGLYYDALLALQHKLTVDKFEGEQRLKPLLQIMQSERNGTSMIRYFEDSEACVFNVQVSGCLQAESASNRSL